MILQISNRFILSRNASATRPITTVLHSKLRLRTQAQMILQI